jgi:ATP-dependent Clp protease ATP-binding subunit ClpA
VAGDTSLGRFTDRARIVVMKSQLEARNRGHREVSSLHLVLGLLSEWEGFAGQAIAAAGVSKEAVAAATEAILPPAGEPIGPHVQFSAGLKKVQELIVREALRLGHNYVGTEHILLGLLEAREEPGTQVLTKFGVSKAAAEAWTLKALDEFRRKRPATSSN